MSKFTLAIAAVAVSLSSAVEAKRTNCTFEEHYTPNVWSQDVLDAYASTLHKYRTIPGYRALPNPFTGYFSKGNVIHKQSMNADYKIELAIQMGEDLYSYYHGPLVEKGKITALGEQVRKTQWTETKNRLREVC